MGLDPNPVIHNVDPTNLSVTNITLPGHIFEGIVHREVVIEDGWYVIRTTGVGDAPGQWFTERVNEGLGPVIFELSKEQIVNYVLNEGGDAATEFHFGEELAERGVRLVEIDGELFQVNNDGTLATPSEEFPLELPERITDRCFVAGTLISMWPLDLDIRPDENGDYDEAEVLSAVWKKPIEEITLEDQVVSYDRNGRLRPGRVTRLYENASSHILNVHGLEVTPGHVTYCGEGRFAGRHVPIIDILRSDGAMMTDAGVKIRAATNCVVGSEGDQLIHAIVGDKTETGRYRPHETGLIRARTRVIFGNGESCSVLELIKARGGYITQDGYVRRNSGGEKMPFRWVFGNRLPRPEDYVLERSQVSLEEIYAAAEWEALDPQIPAPGRVASNPVSKLS